MEESRDQEPTGLTGSAHVLVVSFAHRRRLSLSWWTKIHLSVAWWNTNISWQIWLRVDKIRELVSKTIIYLVSFSVSLISLGSVVQYRLLMIVAIYKNDTRSMVHYIFFNVCDISKRMDMKNLFWILYSLHVLYRNVNIFQTNKQTKNRQNPSTFCFVVSLIMVLSAWNSFFFNKTLMLINFFNKTLMLILAKYLPLPLNLLKLAILQKVT